MGTRSICLKNATTRKALVPDDYLSLDETLYPMRVHISFNQYNPGKPAKYGLLFKSINGARYTHQSIGYSGQLAGEANKFYIAGIINYIQRFVDNFSIHHSLTGRNTSMDRLYSSFEISYW